ncbi:MAG TPA: hypothetical protein VFC93_08095 [Chloroflexota bacterium]|nr:hypothetical protein [Chloroflexota bacterium]
MLRTLGGYVLGATALVACPCHLIFTGPLLLGLVGGTSLGAFLADSPGLMLAAGTGYFVLAILGAVWLLGRRSTAEASAAEAGTGRASAGNACCPPLDARLPVGAGQRETASRG